MARNNKACLNIGGSFEIKLAKMFVENQNSQNLLQISIINTRKRPAVSNEAF